MSHGRIKTLVWIWANTDNITKWIQIVALIVAGYWAYTRFFRTEAPSLETAASLELDVNEHQVGDSCRVTISVGIINKGRSSFDVGRVQIRGWHSGAPQAAVASPVYFDLNKMEQGTKVLDADPPSDLFLNQHYPPGRQGHQTFDWEFKRLDGLNLFRVDAYDRRGTLLSNARHWELRSCGD